jgi:hypothetical protein
MAWGVEAHAGFSSEPGKRRFTSDCVVVDAFPDRTGLIRSNSQITGKILGISLVLAL